MAVASVGQAGVVRELLDGTRVACLGEENKMRPAEQFIFMNSEGLLRTLLAVFNKSSY